MADRENLITEEETKTSVPEEETVTKAADSNDNEEKGECKTDKKKNKKLESEIAELKEKLEKKDTEIKDLNDKYTRMYAEYDNFRKRSAKERDGIYADAYSDAISSILPILDNIERAVGYTDADAVLKGVEMILKGANEVFEKMGVTSFGEKGDKFDPNRHNAVMHIEDESLGENVIVDVFQKGYMKGDKVIRYAMVQVAN